MSLIKNELVYEKDFLRDVRRLPIEQQNKLAELLEIFRDDPFNSRLHTKPLGIPLQGMLSFRITRDYRVGFKFYSSHIIQLLVVDRRDNFYKKLQRKIRNV